MTDPRSRPVYVPPGPGSDAPLDAVEQAWVRALIDDLVREIRQEMAASSDNDSVLEKLDDQSGNTGAVLS